jgi:hypothetical protein
VRIIIFGKENSTPSSANPKTLCGETLTDPISPSHSRAVSESHRRENARYEHFSIFLDDARLQLKLTVPAIFYFNHRVPHINAVNRSIMRRRGRIA